MVATPYSYRQYAGNGSNRDFAVPFPFLVRANVGVYLGLNVTTGAYTTKLVDGTDYTWTNDTSIRTTTAPATGVTLSVMRTTPSSDLAVQWQDGSTLIAEDLLTSDRQNLYVVQENTDLTALNSALSQTATTTANTALTNSTAAQTNAANALSTANTASSTATTALSASNAASSNASAANATSNTANANASAAVTTANTASTNASAAVSTANTASSTATTALSTANSATTAAAAATSTANTASSNASAAVSTANTASTNATAAVSTANTANTNASAAVSTANAASTNANAAVSTANSTTTTANNALTFATAANTKSDIAIAAVSASVAYTPVANVAAIPASPVNDTYISVADTTGLQSFTPLSGIPSGFVGDAGLTARLVYKTATPSWVWVDYYANNADSRYLKLSGGGMTGAIVFAGAQATATTAAAGIVQLTDSTASTSTTTAATPNSVKSAADLASAAGTTANAALPKAGGTMTGVLAVTAGTAALPGIAVSGDTNTGIYSPGADQIGIATGGTSRIVVDASGNVNIDSNTFYVDAANNRVGIGTTSPGYALDVASAVAQVGNSTDAFIQYKSTAGNWHVGANSSNAYAFYSGTYGTGTERARLDSSGRLLVGTSTARGNFFNSTISALIQAEDAGDTTGSLALTRNSNTIYSSSFILAKSRGTSLGSNTIVQSGDRLGEITFQGNDGSQFVTGAAILGEVDGTPGADDMPGRLVFSTTADGASSPTERMRVPNGGGLCVGSTSNPNALTQASGIRLGSSTIASNDFTNVTTTPVTIANGVGIGGMGFVQAYNTSNGAQYTGIIMWRNGIVAVVSESNALGFALTFSVSGSTLRLQTASGTITGGIISLGS